MGRSSLNKPFYLNKVNNYIKSGDYYIHNKTTNKKPKVKVVSCNIIFNFCPIFGISYKIQTHEQVI